MTNICGWCGEWYGLPAVIASHEVNECRAILKAKVDAMVLQNQELRKIIDNFASMNLDEKDRLIRDMQEIVDAAMNENMPRIRAATKVYQDRQRSLKRICVCAPVRQEMARALDRETCPVCFGTVK